MKLLLAAFIVILTTSCSTAPKSTDASATSGTTDASGTASKDAAASPAGSPNPAYAGAYGGGTSNLGTATPTPAEAVASSTPAATATPVTDQPLKADETPDDSVPDFKDITFNPVGFHYLRPRIVEVTSIETYRALSVHARNKTQIEAAVRAGIEKALARNKVSVVSRNNNKLYFEIKDCKNMPDSAECVQIDAVFRSPKFELEVGGYSHNGYSADGSSVSRVAGDITRAYAGAINAVLERLDKQLEIVGLNH
ncbi:MAG: hypothetical protein JST80_04510 [Bdellovibrionales bacterium]|nr:hypothetical protein [Bdellovibrionales bacterium]